MALPHPELEPTVFPDRAVADAIDALRLAAHEVEVVAGQRSAQVTDVLKAWSGRFRDVFVADFDASQWAAAELVSELRTAAARLVTLADEATALRARRRHAYEHAMDDWRDAQARLSNAPPAAGASRAS